MDFVTLELTLAGIAGRVLPPDEIAEHPDLVEAWKYSEAAANLHQQFHNRPEQRPKWLTLHNVTGKPIFSDGAANEGMEILEYVAGWYKRQNKVHNDFFASYSRAGLDPKVELSKDVHYRKYKMGTLGHAHRIGFDRPEVARFLNDCGVRFAYWIGDDQAGQQSVQPLPQRRHQDHEILPVIGGLPSETAKGESRSEKRAAPKLTLPDKSDTWAKAIEATYEILIQETGSTPSGVEVWLRMNHKPPGNYPIKVTKDHGFAALAMPGEKLLTRDGFTKRWSRYTSAK